MALKTNTPEWPLPVTSGQVIDFTIGNSGSGGAPESSRSDGGTTTVSIYGQSILTCAGGLGSTGINGADGSSSAGITCSSGGGMGYFQSNLAGTGGSGTFPGSNSAIYKADDPSSESGNGGLNNLGQPVMQGFTSGLGGAGGGPNTGYSAFSLETPNGSYRCGGSRAFGGINAQLSGGNGRNGYV